MDRDLGARPCSASHAITPAVHDWTVKAVVERDKRVCEHPPDG